MTHQAELRGERAEQDRERTPDYAPDDESLEDDLVEARNEIWDRLQDANQVWLERIQNEAALTIELASKLTASRSFAETTEVLRHWTEKHVEMATEDTRRLVADTQQMINVGVRFWTIASERSGSDAYRA